MGCMICSKAVAKVDEGLCEACKETVKDFGERAKEEAKRRGMSLVDYLIFEAKNFYQ